MSISWGNWDVRVYAAEAWVSLAPRYAVEHPRIVDQIETILGDPSASVRLQAAQNLQVLSLASPERMWAMGERIVRREPDARIVTAFLNSSMQWFAHSEPEQCEKLLLIVKERLSGDLAHNADSRDHVQESLGGWTAQLFAHQGRPLTSTWLDEWAANLQRFGGILDHFASSLRDAFFYRYDSEAKPVALETCDRAQSGLQIILTSAIRVSEEAHAVLLSDAAEHDLKSAGERYSAAERVINHAMNQIYFGAGVFVHGSITNVGLRNQKAMARFLADYVEILALFARSREPATIHHLIELYEFLVSGDPITVFETTYTILLGRGKAERYHHESLANTAIVRIIQQYIADYRTIFDDDDRRAKLVEILQLFSDVGWPEALKLLYELPDLLR